MMKKTVVFILALAAAFNFIGCSSALAETESSITQAAAEQETQVNEEAYTDTLVVYFSRAGENYGVGVIEKGNTEIVAEMIAEETGADLFKIQTVDPYPEGYDECTDIAQQEKQQDARPEIVGTVENMQDYQTIFVGYPIWWGDMPMALYSFLEQYDFSGKTVIPFCTHAGSGMSATAESLRNELPGATVLEGLAVSGETAQNDREEVKVSVSTWLEGIK